VGSGADEEASVANHAARTQGVRHRARSRGCGHRGLAGWLAGNAVGSSTRARAPRVRLAVGSQEVVVRSPNERRSIAGNGSCGGGVGHHDEK
jgi:hypothetical protein